MRKIKLVTGFVGVCAVALVAGTALAAPVGKLGTNGIIQFTPDGGQGEIIKPDEEGAHEEIITDLPGKTGEGDLRIQFVPDLNFGVKRGITSNEQRKSAELLDYKGKVIPAGKIPPFVQVSNNTGDNTNTWTLFVKGTPFSEAGGDILTGAYISLNGSTLTTTGGTSAEAAAIATGQTETKIPLSAADDGIVVLKSTAGTNGKQISNVFHNGYKYGDTYTGEATGVEFVKPAGKAALKNVTYSSTLTWSLVDAL